MPVLDELINHELPARVRSNHALEHATLHVLEEQGYKGRFGGISDAGGFYVYGDIPTEALLLSAKEALKRLKEGEAGLAVHANCGTNMAVSGLAAGGMAWMTMLGTKGKFWRRMGRLPVAVLAGLVGYQVSKPLGPRLQEAVTTNAEVGNLAVIEVVQHELMGAPIHRVKTRYSPQA